MYTQTKTEIQQRIAITEWLEANLSQFKNQKTYFIIRSDIPDFSDKSF